MKNRQQYSFIYAIYDATGRCRYVGKSDDPLQRYFGHHCMGRDKSTSRMMLEHLKAHLEPRLHILDRVVKDVVYIRETFWIRKLTPDLNTLKKEKVHGDAHLLHFSHDEDEDKQDGTVHAASGESARSRNLPVRFATGGLATDEGPHQSS